MNIPTMAFLSGTRHGREAVRAAIESRGAISSEFVARWFRASQPKPDEAIISAALNPKMLADVLGITVEQAEERSSHEWFTARGDYARGYEYGARDEASAA